MSPIRVQRRRSKGWRAPLCSCGCGKTARYVGRGSKWGNPYQASRMCGEWTVSRRQAAQHRAAQLFRLHLDRQSAEHLTELRGHDLMCWCSTDSPCHGDALLDLANRDSS